MISVHDNHIRSYLVDHDKKQIVFHTVFKDKGEPFEYTDILFEGVFCYQFVNDTFGTILLDVEECPLDQLVKDNGPLFIDGCQYGWPEGGYGSVEVAIRDLTTKGAAGWILSSSIGMTGFIIARSIKIGKSDT